MTESTFATFSSYPLVKQLASATNADLVADIGGVFQFVVGKDGKTASVTIDLKNGSGSVAFVANDSADCTFKVNDEDFAAMIKGDTDPTELFMEGKLKISGDMGMAMKFQNILEDLDLDAVAEQTSAASDSHNPLAAFKTGVWVQVIRDGLKSKNASVQGVFVFSLTKGPGGQQGHFIIDTQASPAAVTVAIGEATKDGDCGFRLTDADCADLFSEDVEPEELFMDGKLKISGDMGLALQFKEVLQAAKPQSKL